jgi:predicted nuclease of predicted toxin-antitoxin system
MKLLFDHNLSFRLVPALGQSFPGSMHVRDLGLSTADDFAIWDYARQNGFAIVSKDSDFFHRSMLLGHPPKVVWIS